MSSDTVVRHHTALPFIGGVVLAVLPCRVPQNYGDFNGLFCGSALLGLKSLPHPLSWVLGRSVFGFL